MLSLILFRHGKSDWSADNGNDRDRPLAQRGVRAARTMGAFLASTGQLPDKVLCSPAQRARETVNLASRQGNWPCPIEIAEQLYESNAKQVLGFLQAHQDETSTLLLTGHEPIWSELCSRLVGEHANIRFPTAAMARIDLPIRHWQDIRFGCGELRWLMPPKLLVGKDIRFE